MKPLLDDHKLSFVILLIASYMLATINVVP